MNQKIGIVDVGGGYRGVYAAGVTDWLMLQPMAAAERCRLVYKSFILSSKYDTKI